MTFAAAAAAAGSCNNGTVQLETCCELQDASQLQSYFSITVVVLYFDWQYGCMHVQAELNIAELELTFSLACSNPPQADQLLLHEEDSRQTQAEEFEDMEIDRQFEKGNTDDESEDEDMDIT